jgi:hypothetical protein
MILSGVSEALEPDCWQEEKAREASTSVAREIYFIAIFFYSLQSK